MLTPAAVVVLIAASVVVGALIGSVGVGGVLLVPALVVIGSLDAHAATATSSWAFLFTGAIGTWRYSRSGAIRWLLVGRLAFGVVPGALLGVWVNQLLPTGVVLLAVAAVAVLAGVQTLLTHAPDAPRRLSTFAAAMTGALVGFGSALTGSGGPVLLVPALLVLGMTPLVAVAAGQAIQLPVVVIASLGFLATGIVRIGLGTVLGLAAAAGVLIGAAAARHLGPVRLRQAVGLACCATGLVLLVRIALTALAPPD